MIKFFVILLLWFVSGASSAQQLAFAKGYSEKGVALCSTPIGKLEVTEAAQNAAKLKKTQAPQSAIPLVREVLETSHCFAEGETITVFLDIEHITWEHSGAGRVLMSLSIISGGQENLTILRGSVKVSLTAKRGDLVVARTSGQAETQKVYDQVRKAIGDTDEPLGLNGPWADPSIKTDGRLLLRAIEGAWAEMLQTMQQTKTAAAQ